MNDMNLSRGDGTQAAMDIRLVVVDETQFYSADITNVGSRVYQTYAFDAARAYHACDISPSFELHPLNRTPANFIEDYDARGALHETLDDVNAGAQPILWYCHALSRIPATHTKAYHVITLDEDEPYDVQFERVLDDLRGNVQLELPANMH